MCRSCDGSPRACCSLVRAARVATRARGCAAMRRSTKDGIPSEAGKRRSGPAIGAVSGVGDRSQSLSSSTE
eukprot:3348561-Pleurochrysis_carterae.AAC.1